MRETVPFRLATAQRQAAGPRRADPVLGGRVGGRHPGAAVGEHTLAELGGIGAHGRALGLAEQLREAIEPTNMALYSLGNRTRFREGSAASGRFCGFRRTASGLGNCPTTERGGPVTRCIPPTVLIALSLAVDFAAAATRPNVIVVMTDDQGYGDLSCHGNPVLRTPNLDRLHEQSVRLIDFHVAPMCTPTRGQLLSCRDALDNGAMNFSSGRSMLRCGLPTSADQFSAAGYSTGQFGKWHVGDVAPYRPQDRGFHEPLFFPSSHIGSAADSWNNGADAREGDGAPGPPARLARGDGRGDAGPERRL